MANGRAVVIKRYVFDEDMRRRVAQFDFHYMGHKIPKSGLATIAQCRSFITTAIEEKWLHVEDELEHADESE